MKFSTFPFWLVLLLILGCGSLNFSSNKTTLSAVSSSEANTAEEQKYPMAIFSFEKDNEKNELIFSLKTTSGAVIKERTVKMPEYEGDNISKIQYTSSTEEVLIHWIYSYYGDRCYGISAFNIFTGAEREVIPETGHCIIHAWVAHPKLPLLFAIVQDLSSSSLQVTDLRHDGRIAKLMDLPRAQPSSIGSDALNISMDGKRIFGFMYGESGSVISHYPLTIYDLESKTANLFNIPIEVMDVGITNNISPDVLWIASPPTLISLPDIQSHDLHLFPFTEVGNARGLWSIDGRYVYFQRRELSVKEPSEGYIYDVVTNKVAETMVPNDPSSETLVKYGIYYLDQPVFQPDSTSNTDHLFER